MISFQVVAVYWIDGSTALHLTKQNLCGLSAGSLEGSPTWGGDAHLKLQPLSCDEDDYDDGLNNGIASTSFDILLNFTKIPKTCK